VREVVVFLLLGVGFGALISGAGIGVVLSYRGAGVINLAVGGVAMLSGYCFWSLRDGYFGASLSTVPAVIVTLVFSVIIGTIFECLVVIPLRNAAPLAKLVGSLGFLVSAMAAISIAFGAGGRPQPSFLPSGILHLFGYELLVNRFVIAAVVSIIAVVLVVLYRFTRFGLATRAASENELHSALAGLSPRWISLTNTILMSLVMAVVGLLAASIQVLDPTDLPLLVVPALAAALFGSLSSIATTFVAGTIIGALDALLVYLSTLSWFPSFAPGDPIPGVQELLTFIVLLVAVYFRGGRIPGRGELIERRLPPAPRPKSPLRSTLVYGIPAVVCLGIFPMYYRIALITSLIWAILLLSIMLITGFVGQVSIAQLALGGIAGFGTGEVAYHWGAGFPLAPILGVCVAAIVGFLTGIPALRVRGVSLVIVTLAAAVAMENFVFANNSVDRTALYITVPKSFGIIVSPSEPIVFDGTVPSLFFGWLVFAVLVVVALFVCNVRRSRVGQEMLAVRANERAASAIGINVRNVKLLGFTLAAVIAGIGGIFVAYSYGVVSSGSSDTVTALTLIAFAYIGGITTVPGAILGGLIFTGNLLTFCLQQWFGVKPAWITLIAGIVLIAVLVWVPEGVGGALFYRQRRTRPGRLFAPGTPRVGEVAPIPE
jgi:branched-chain amino acid transport system permease protein